MRPVPPPGRLVRAAAAFIFIIVNFCLFVASAVAWSNHKYLCVTEWADLLAWGLGPADVPTVFCGVVRWYTYALLVGVSIIGLFLGGGIVCAAIFESKDHKKGTCTATFAFLFLLLLTIIVGWTPPLSPSPSTAVACSPSPHHHVKPHHVSPLHNRANDENAVKLAHHKKKKSMEQMLWNEPDLIVDSARLVSGAHVGFHRITGAFLLDVQHHDDIGSTKAAVLLAHLTL
jgi:hypothetical protein